jgi:hypothetical protein
VRVQIVACLLSLLILGVSLDGLPDPPAVTPQRNLNKRVHQLHSHAPLAAHNPACDYTGSDVHFQASLFSFGQIAEAKSPSYGLVFIRQAADLSPPSFFRGRRTAYRIR